MGAFEEYIKYLKQEVSKKGEMSKIELIRFIYINFGQMMNFDLNYTFGNRKQKENIYNRILDDEEIMRKREGICKDLSILLARVYKEFDINCRVVKSDPYSALSHVYNQIELPDGKILNLDLEEDLEYIKTFAKTRYFGVKNPDNDLELDFLTEEEIKKMDTGIVRIYTTWILF